MDDQEEERLRRLHDLHLLDSPQEKDFDDIARLAAAICGTPIALVSLIDRDRQVFKASTGIDVTETPRSQSVCAHTMLRDGVLEIPDTTADPLTRANPLVDDPAVAMKFYAGAPLTLDDGTPLGALCVLDNHPRRLTAFQREALETLARQVNTQIALRRALRESEDIAQRLKEAIALQDVLSREMDHRVRNSLQQVSSFLRLQAQRAGREDVTRELGEAQRRIAAIAAIHSALHHSGGTETVVMKTYFRVLAENLGAALPAGVTLTMEADDLHLPSNRASAIAVIANEFVANSMKYAFPHGAGGRIEVELRRGDGGLLARFRDDGVGIVAGAPSVGTGLGMRIIEASASQIEGEIRFVDGPGTILELRAPV